MAIVDPGPDLPPHLDALERAVDGRTVSHILVTHTHSDHCGGARALANRLKAPIYGGGAHPVRKREEDAPALDEGADYDFSPDEIVEDAATLSSADWTIDCIATPGHLSNHMCFGLREEKALFTGDHIMGWSTTVVAPPDGDMGAYMDSLDKLLARDDALYLPTHGAPIENPQRFVRAVRTHRRIRDGQIIGELNKGAATVREIVATIYADVDPRLHMAAALNVLAHLQRLRRVGDVECDGDPTMHATYRLSQARKNRPVDA